MRVQKQKLTREDKDTTDRINSVLIFLARQQEKVIKVRIEEKENKDHYCLCEDNTIIQKTTKSLHINWQSK